MAQTVKNLPAMQQTWVLPQGGEDPLEEGMATHSSILPGEFCGKRSLAGYSPLGPKELDLTEQLSLSLLIHSDQIRSVAQLCPTLCDPMNHSTPGLPVHHQLLEFTETHVHQISDAIQPSHPLSSPSPPAPNPSQLLVTPKLLTFT